MSNGFTGIFMVASVTAVSGIAKTKCDERRRSHTDSGKNNSGSLFAQILDDKASEAKENVVDCHTTTYGRDSKMQNFQYRMREYRY